VRSHASRDRQTIALQPSLGKQTYHGKCNANASYSSNAKYVIYSLSGCLGTSSRLTGFSQHAEDRFRAREGKRIAIEALPVPGMASAGPDLADGGDDPTAWKCQKLLGPIGALDWVFFKLLQDSCECPVPVALAPPQAPASLRFNLCQLGQQLPLLDFRRKKGGQFLGAARKGSAMGVGKKPPCVVHFYDLGEPRFQFRHDRRGRPCRQEHAPGRRDIEFRDVGGFRHGRHVDAGNALAGRNREPD
jgi:hypothetical protein